jgi:hypothetical protein
MSPREYSLEYPPARLGVDCRSCKHLKAFVADIDTYKQFGATASWALLHASRCCKGTPKQEDIDPSLEYWQQDDAKLCTIGLLKSRLDADLNIQKNSSKTE